MDPNNTPSCCEGQRGIRRESRLRIRDEKREEVPRGLVHSSPLDLLVLHVTTRNAVSTPFSLSLLSLRKLRPLYASKREKERERGISTKRTDVLRNVALLRNDVAMLQRRGRAPFTPPYVRSSVLSFF